jgi:hypothetical protein
MSGGAAGSASDAASGSASGAAGRASTMAAPVLGSAGRGTVSVPSAGSMSTAAVGGRMSAAVGGSDASGAAGQPADQTPSAEYTTEPSDPASYLFDQTQVRTYNIQVAPADLAKLDQNPSAEAYVQGMLEFEGQVIGPLGVRYKGGYSGFQLPCSDGMGAPKSGKCSIKLAFDEVNKDARFYGLKKLNLHSMNADHSLMHDRLGYSLYREFGVVAPRAMHVRVFVNGVAQGLFIAVEQIDGRFTRARFGDGGEGNVYKEIWPIYSDTTVYQKALETNSAQGQVQGMLSFASTVTRNDAAGVAEFIDRDYTLRYLAVDRVIQNDDGVMHFWCSAQASGNNPNEFGNHNYFWYQEQTRNKFWLIPWDLDISFEPDPDAHILLPWYRTGECKCMAVGAGFQQPSACDPLVQTFIGWQADYELQVDDFIAGPFEATAVESKLATWSDQIMSAVADSQSTPSAVSVSDWQRALNKLRSSIQSSRAHRGYAY